MTSITTKNGNRILIKMNGTEVKINDGDLIQYSGIYYKRIYDIIETVKVETTFIGIVESCKYRHDTGIQGIYVRPLYIWDIMNSEWYKLVDLDSPSTKYFLYPHLLMLLQCDRRPSCYYPLYVLETCVNKSLDEFVHVKKKFDLYL